MAERTVKFNVYVDPSYSDTTTPATSPITGEALAWGVNAFNSIDTNYVTDVNGDTVYVDEGYTVYYNGFDFSGSNKNLLHTPKENIYIANTTVTWIYSVPYNDPRGEIRNSPFTRTTDMVIYMDNVGNYPVGDQNSGFFLLGMNNTPNNFTANLDITIKNSSLNTINFGSGNGQDNYDNRGKQNGTIVFNVENTKVTGSGNWGNFALPKGNFNRDAGKNVIGTLTNVTINNNFFGFKTGGSNVVEGNIFITITGSSVRNSIQFGSFNPSAGSTPNGTFIGTGTFSIAGSTAATIQGNPREGEGKQANATYNLNLIADAEDRATVANTIQAFHNINVEAGAHVRANSIALGGVSATTLTLDAKAMLEVGSIGSGVTIDLVNVTDLDTVVLYNFDGTLADGQLKVNGVDVKKYSTSGDYSNTYESVGGNLVYHNAGTTLLVNSKYTDGEDIPIGDDEEEVTLKGYKTFASAQAAADAQGLDKATTRIVLNENIERGNVFSTDVVTKDYNSYIVGRSEDNAVNFYGYNLIIGSLEQDLSSAFLSLSNATNINTVKFGNLASANVSLGNVVSSEVEIPDPEDEEETITVDVPGIVSFDMRGATLTNAKVSISNSQIGEMNMGANEASTGRVTISGTTIGDFYAGKNGLEVAFSGESLIKNVYTEGQAGDTLDFGDTSITGKYVAGSMTAGTSFDEFKPTVGANAKELIIGGYANTFGSIDANASGSGDILSLGGENDVVTNDAKLVAKGDFNEITLGKKVSVGGDVNVEITGGEIHKLAIVTSTQAGEEEEEGEEGNDATVTGNVNLKLSGGKIDEVIVSDKTGAIGGNVTVELAGGTVAPMNNGAVISGSGNTANSFPGLVYGASVTNVLDGGILAAGKTADLLVSGNAKIAKIQDFTSLVVTGGTLNVAGGEGHDSEVDADKNTLTITGDITNSRGISAGAIYANNLYNYGLVGTLRASGDQPGITLNGDLFNTGYVKTSKLTIAGDFLSTGKVTTAGDITVNGTGDFINDGELYVRSSFSLDGVFSQEGGITLNNVDFMNTGFVSTGKLLGVKNLTTAKLYSTAGAEIAGDLTILAGAEVAFTNKADSTKTQALILGGSINMYADSRLIVSGDLASGKTIAVNVGDMVGSNEIIRTERDLQAANWTVNLSDTANYKWEYSADNTAIVVYSTAEVFVNSSYTADKKIFVNGNQLLFGKNAFATVADAIAATSDKSEIVIIDETKAIDVSAAGRVVAIRKSDAGIKNKVNIALGTVSAAGISVETDCTIATIADTAAVSIDADSKLTITDTIAENQAIAIDATAGSGSRLNLVFDPEKVTIDPAQVTVVGEGSALIDATGKVYLQATGNVFYGASFYKTVTEGEGDDAHEVIVPNFQDGAIDPATGDVLFAGVNVFSTKEAAIEAAKAAKGNLYLVGISNGEQGEGYTTVLEYTGAANVIGAPGDSFVSDQDYTTVLSGGSYGENYVYGLNNKVNMSGDFTFIADGITQGAGDGYRFFIVGGDNGNVVNGDVTARITDSTIRRTAIGAGSFGQTEGSPIKVDVEISNSTVNNGFHGIVAVPNNMDVNARQDINADIDIKIYDSVIGGTFTVIDTNNEHWNGNGATLLQTYFTSGSINVEIGGTRITDNIRTGLSLELAGKAPQAFNVPNTLHIVATDYSTVTDASYLCEWDTIIVDATARLNLNTLQYSTTAIGNTGDNILDNRKTLTQVMINMSGYESGTHLVINASGEIYSDVNLSNITVIGDNDLTGQCQLAYSGTMNGEGQITQLKRIYIFDKTDNMYVNSTYSDSVSGTVVDGQEMLFKYNAHTTVEAATKYADDWHGSIIVSGGSFVDNAVDFHGNNVTINGGAVIGSMKLAGEKVANEDGAATLTIKAGANVSDITVSDVTMTGANVVLAGAGAAKTNIDGSKANVANSILDIKSDNELGIVKDFDDVNIAKGAEVTFSSLSGSNVKMSADTVITAGSFDISGAKITIDVTGFEGTSHVIVDTVSGVTGFAGNFVIDGEKKDQYSVIQVENSLVLTTSIKSDVYVNSDYTAAITGTILEDGTYLEYGFNAFSTIAEATANLGSPENTITVTGGTFNEDVILNGGSFVMESGVLNGNIYANNGSDVEGISITIGDGSTIGNIELTSDAGAYIVTDSTITLGDNVTVNGGISGDSVLDGNKLILNGSATFVGLIDNIGDISLNASSTLTAGGINGGELELFGKAPEFVGGGNVSKVISTMAGVNNVTLVQNPGLTIFKSANGNDVYLLDTSRIYVDTHFTEAISNTTEENFGTGDTLIWNSNAFNTLEAGDAALVTGGTLFISNWGNAGSQGADIRPSKDANIVAQGPTNFSVVYGNNGGDGRTVDVPVTIYIQNSGMPQGGTSIIHSGNDNARWIFKDDVTITMQGPEEGRTDLNSQGSFSFFRRARFDGGKDQVVQVNILRKNLTNDVTFFKRAQESDFNNVGTIEINIVDCYGANDRWFRLFSSDDGTDTDPTVSAPNVVLNLTNTYLHANNQNWSIALVNQGANSRKTFYSVHLSGSTVDGIISGLRNRNQSVPGTTSQYAGTRTLFVDAGENQVARANQFHHIAINANASLVATDRNGVQNNAAGAIQFLASRTASDGNSGGLDDKSGFIVDLTDYAGEDKMLISAPSFYYGTDRLSSSNWSSRLDLVVNGNDDGKFLVNLGVNYGLYLVTEKGDVYYSNEVSAEQDGLAFGDTFVYFNPNENPEEAETKTYFNNAYSKFDDAKAGLALREGTCIYVNENIEDEENGHNFFADGYSINVIGGSYTNVVGADDSEAAVASVNMTITDGLFGNVLAAMEDDPDLEITTPVAGEANITLVGGTFGNLVMKDYEYEDEEEETIETEVIDMSKSSLSKIGGGSTDVVTGTRTLTVSNDLKVVGSVENFDLAIIDANLTVTAGDFSATEILIDASKTLTVSGVQKEASGGVAILGGSIDATTITIDASNYDGPTRAVALSDTFLSGARPAVVIDGDTETYSYRYVEDKLYLISQKAGNVYLNASWNESISGKTLKSNNDLLMYGINAFSNVKDAAGALSTDYKMYVEGGNFAGQGVLDLSAVNNSNGNALVLDVYGGTFDGIKVLDGADSDHRTAIYVNNGIDLNKDFEYSPVSAGTVEGSGSTVGYTLSVGKDATFGDITGVRTLNVVADANIQMNGVAFRENGGTLAINMANIDPEDEELGDKLTLFTLPNGLKNFFVNEVTVGQKTETVIDEETGEPKEVTVDVKSTRNYISTSNNAGYIVYYDDATSSIVAEKRDKKVGVISGTASNLYDGTTIEYEEGKFATLAYGYNVYYQGDDRVYSTANLDSDGTLLIDHISSGSFVTQNPIKNVKIDFGTFTGNVAFGFQNRGADGTREGEFNLTVNDSRFTGGTKYLAGSGEDGNREQFNITGDWNLEFNRIYTDQNGANQETFKIVNNATMAGDHEINIAFNDSELRSDLQLFTATYGAGPKAVNVTMTDVRSTDQKWCWIWDGREDSSTAITLTIKNSFFIGARYNLGLFNDSTRNWNGKADVYISGITISQGRLSGGRGSGENWDDGIDESVTGQRVLHVQTCDEGKTNYANVVRDFTGIVIEDGAFLSTDRILFAAPAAGADASNGFTLIGSADYNEGAKEFATATTSITGRSGNPTAKFVTAEGAEIEGYTAVVGSKSVFVYDQSIGGIYVDSTYSLDTTGTAITEADGTKNFLVYGDNAVKTMDEAYKDRGGKPATIQVNNLVSEDLYANGYKLIVNGGTFGTVYGGGIPTIPATGDPIPAEAVASADITVLKGATVTSIKATSDLSPVSGDSLITIGDGAAILGTIEGAGASSSLVFQGSASAAEVAKFNAITLTAAGLVELKAISESTTITIDAAGFTDFTKKVMTVEGGFGDTSKYTVKVENGGEGYGYQFMDDKTLVITTSNVGSVYTDATWTKETVDDTFIGDMALVWGQNAFNTIAGAANAGGSGDILIEGGEFAKTEEANVSNNVIVKASTAGTVVGSIASTNAGTLTVSNDLSAAALTGFSAITINAATADDIVVDGAVTVAEGGKVTIDVTGYKQEGFEQAIISAGSFNLTTENVEIVGEGKGAYHLEVTDTAVSLMRIDNFYVDVNYKEDGSGIEPGQVNPITGEKLMFGVNAFYSLTNALASMVDGQNLYINDRPYNTPIGGKQYGKLVITDSAIQTLSNEFAGGDHVYEGDVEVSITNSTVGNSDARSYILGNVTGDAPYQHNNIIRGDVTVNAVDSVIGSYQGNSNISLYEFTRVLSSVDTPEELSHVVAGFTNTSILSNMRLVGDSPTDAVWDSDDGDVVGTDVTLNLVNVDTGTASGRTWALSGGSSGNTGTFYINVTDSTLGSGNMVFAIEENWGEWGNPANLDNNIPESHANYIFTLTDSAINGNLQAGRLTLTTTSAELPAWDGKKVLNLKGDNAITNTYWFREVNFSDNGTLTGTLLRMGTDIATITIDETTYDGSSKVVIKMANKIERGSEGALLGLDAIKEIPVAVAEGEDPVYTLLTDYSEEAGGFTTVVLKGQIKDIYVNSDYTDAKVKLGDSAHGEALFANENAFADLTAGVAALTDGANLYVTGGKAQALGTDTLNCSITIDAGARVNYSGETAITVVGDLNIAATGTIMITAAPFITTSPDDVVVLTATALNIEEGAVLRTTVDSYELKAVGNELHLVAKQSDLYVNAAWMNEAAGSTVTVAEGIEAVVGTDAFGVFGGKDGAFASSSSASTITVIASDADLSGCAINCTVIATEGSTLNNVAISKATGSVKIESGAAANKVNVTAGSFTVETGASVTGGLGILSGVSVTFAEGSTLDFDITNSNVGDGAYVTNFDTIVGTPVYTLTGAEGKRAGVYTLASNAAGFGESELVMSDTVSLKLDVAQTIGNFVYTLGMTDNNELALTKGVLKVYVNSTWTEAVGATVAVAEGVNAVIGTDAFKKGDDAVAVVDKTGSIEVLAGEVSFTDAISSTVTIDGTATLVGKATFATDITIDGTVAFDTALTADGAQFNGLSYVKGATKYTLSDATPTIGASYLLATDAAGFNGTIDFVYNDVKYSLALGDTIVADAYKYTLAVDAETSELTLAVSEYIKPKVLPTATFVAASEDALVLAGATVGYDGFLTGDAAVAALDPAKDGTVEVLDGNVYFSNAIGGKVSITIDAAATLTRSADFSAAKSLTVNGSVAFDTQYVGETAQFVGLGKAEGTAAGYDLAVIANPTDATYTLATGFTAFDASVTYGEDTLSVAAGATTIGTFVYTLGLTDGALTLTVEKVPATKGYVNSTWTGKAAGEIVDGHTIGYDAFASLDAAEAVESIVDIEVTGGEITVTSSFTKAITVDAAAKVVGTNVFDKAITIDGEVAFDTQYATTTAAQISGLSFVTGNATYTLTGDVATGNTYLLATGASAFASSIAFGAFTLQVGETVTDTTALLTYTLDVTDGTLGLTVGTYTPSGKAVKAYVNSAWAGLADGTEVDGHTIGFDAFDTLAKGEAADTEEAKIEVVGGEISVTGSFTKAITVDAAAKVVGVNAFEAAITINGEVAFDTQYATTTAAQISGLSFVTGNATYTLTGDVATGNTYLLATGAAAFASDITFGAFTLQVGKTVDDTVAGLTYALDVTDGTLALTVGTYVPPTPVATTVYVDSTWAGKTTGETVTFVNGDGETVTATIGTDAFATGDAAAAAVVEDGAIEVVGGSVSFTDPITEETTVDKNATLTGKVTFVSGATINGTLAFDGTEGQVTGLENVTFGDEAKVTVTGNLTEAGQSFKLSAPMDTKVTPITDNPLFGQKITATINGNEDDKYQIGSAYFAAADGISYVLELSQKGELVLSAVKQEQVNTQNDELVVKSDPNKQLNPYVSDANAHFAPITLEFTDVLVDPTGEVSHVGTTTYFNYVERNSDKADYGMITLDHAAKLSFTISATDKVKLTLVQANQNTKTGKYSEKSLKNTSVTKAGGGTSKATAAVFVEKGTYYLKVEAKGKADVDTWYNVNLADIGANTYIYADGDDGSNKWVYDKKQTTPLNPRAYADAVNPLQKIDITETVSGKVYQIDDPAELTLSPSTEYTNFVGWGDNIDFAKISATQPIALSLTVWANENVKAKVYKLEKNAKGTAWVLKALQTVTLNVNKSASASSKTALVLDRLGINATGEDATGYYVSVESTNKKGNAYYKLAVDAKVFEYSDDGTNGSPLKGTAQINPDLAPATTIGKELKEIDMEVTPVSYTTDSGKTFSNYVGFGDEWDYAEIVINGTVKEKVTLSIETYGTAKVTSKAMILKYTYKNGKWVKSSVGTVTAKTDANTQLGSNSKTFTIKELTKNSGDTPQQGDVRYFVAVQAGSAKKNTDVWYNVSASYAGAESASLSMPETDNLAIADSLSFGQNTDALADASAFGLADSQLIDDKQSALGLLA